jgi:hypothetical protein
VCRCITANWSLLEAQGQFFKKGGAGGQLRDFKQSVDDTKEKDLRLDPNDDQVVKDGHYIWFKHMTGSRLTEDNPVIPKLWPLISRVLTAQGSLNASGTTTPRVRMPVQTIQIPTHPLLTSTQADSIRRERRKTDGRCCVTGRLALDRGEPRGQDWTTLHCAHVLPLAWSTKEHVS